MLVILKYLAYLKIFYKIIKININNIDKYLYIHLIDYISIHIFIADIILNLEKKHILIQLFLYTQNKLITIGESNLIRTL